MSRVLVEFQKIENYKKGIQCGKSGKEGSCYYINDDIIIKIFHIFVDCKRVYFDDLKNDHIAFPIDVYIDSLVKLETAYTMKFLPGSKMINGISKKIDIENLKQAYLSLRKIIENYKDINMYDMCLANILYDAKTNSLNLIDTSRWYPLDKSFNENILQFNNCLCYSLFRYNLEWLKDLDDKEPLHKVYEKFFNNDFIDFSELLDIIIYEMNKKSEKKIKTFGDLSFYQDKFKKKS